MSYGASFNIQLSRPARDENDAAAMVLGMFAGLEEHWDRQRQLRAIERIRSAFFHPVPGGLEPIPHRAYLGLGWWRTPQSFGANCLKEMGARHPAPFGWRWLNEHQRNAAVLLPLWLYWPVRLWRDRWSLVCDPLERLGFLRAPYDGCWYREMRPTLPAPIRRFVWCFLNDADHGGVC